MATYFFSELLGRGVARAHDISLVMAGLPSIDLSRLEVAFSEEEAWTEIKDMPANRALGPNGFSWDFYQNYWPIIKHDVVAALMDVYLDCGQHFGAINGALITLLPKMEGAVELKDFRPISLVHSFAKLLAKILVLRLAPKMPDLVDANQSTFVCSHCKHDNFVLVQQSARSLFRSKVTSLCSDEIIDMVGPALPCPLGQFPCKYLGLPLSLTKLRKCDIQPIIDKLSQNLPFWKAKLQTREGRVAYV
ncbi:hypothetical protein ACQ4PT_059188 [Festuca glaucescens]